MALPRSAATMRAVRERDRGLVQTPGVLEHVCEQPCRLSASA